ncbi:MAG: type III PLP-dependent enzyme, partial [Pseudomonadota bacterium]
MSTRLQGAAAPVIRPPHPRDTARPRYGTPRLRAYLAEAAFDRPTLVIDLKAVEQAYRALASALPTSALHYAVKANPHPAILARLAALGCRFDAASRGEIALCRAAGAPASAISFGNTIKRAGDIAYAHAQGIDLFAVDAAEEIDKIAAHAPGAGVYVRLLVETSEAAWPLSRKFGAAPETVLPLLARARSAGLRPVGLSFHVGSQAERASMWLPALDTAAAVWTEAHAAGFPLTLLNIGGGFPADYGNPVDPTPAYGAALSAALAARFGPDVAVMAEPGRGLVADAGIIAAEVLLVARKRDTDLARWVYLDIGKFSGLAETIDEAIRYRIETEADDRPLPGTGTGIG